MTASNHQTPPAESSPPTAGRAIGLMAVSVAAGVVLLAVPSAGLPAGAGDLLPWWTRVGTPDATMAILRGLGVAAAAATMLLAILGLVVAISPAQSVVRLWSRLAPRSLRRLIAASALAGSTLTATVAGAAETEPPPVIVDLGTDGSVPTAGPLPVLRDLGPADSRRRDPVPTDVDVVPAETAQTWTVEPGDHLWRIAAETVAARGTEPSAALVAPYWRRLIEANRAVIGDDADLIHPGDVLTLPE